MREKEIQTQTDGDITQARLKGSREKRGVFFFPPEKLLRNSKHTQSVVKRKEPEPPPVVRCVGFVYLHQAVIFVGWMVRG